MYSFTQLSLGLLAVCQLVAGHGAIIKAVGDAGGAGSAIGGLFYHLGLLYTDQSSFLYSCT